MSSKMKKKAKNKRRAAARKGKQTPVSLNKAKPSLVFIIKCNIIK